MNPARAVIDRKEKKKTIDCPDRKGSNGNFSTPQGGIQLVISRYTGQDILSPIHFVMGGSGNKRKSNKKLRKHVSDAINNTHKKKDHHENEYYIPSATQ